MSHKLRHWWTECGAGSAVASTNRLKTGKFKLVVLLLLLVLTDPKLIGKCDDAVVAVSTS